MRFAFAQVPRLIYVSPVQELTGTKGSTMTYSQLRRWVQVSADTILDVLTRKQFVHPHATLEQILTETLQELGAPPDSGNSILQRLSLDPAGAIGRLRRCELTQLARVLHREWRSAGDSDR